MCIQSEKNFVPISKSADGRKVTALYDLLEEQIVPRHA